MNEDELEKERMRRVEVAAKYGDLIQKIKIEPGLVWLECTEGFAAQWSGRKLFPEDAEEIIKAIYENTLDI